MGADPPFARVCPASGESCAVSTANVGRQFFRRNRSKRRTFTRDAAGEVFGEEIAITWERFHPAPRLNTTGAEAVGIWAKKAVFAETRARILVAVVTPILAGAVWLLLASPTVFSREMSWDLLFNLDGAWNLWNGRQLHVDVHDPLGTLTFSLTALGFHFVGVGPRAFLVGETLYAAAMLAASICVLPRRLPLAAAAVATLYVVLLVLVPINLGDPIELYSFAMSYNRFGWSALALLFAALFLEARGKKGDRLDQGIVFFLGVLLFYLKITYFVVGIGAIIVALVLSPHTRSRTAGWLAVLAALGLVAAAPFNIGYWQDILAALKTGAARQDVLAQLKNVLTSRDTAIVAVELICLLWLQRAGASWDRLASAVFIIGCGAIVLSQNQQSDGIALYLVVALLLFDGARKAIEGRMRQPTPGTALLLGAVLISPAIHVASMATSILGYHLKAAAADNYVVADTNLRGLAVSPERPNLVALFSGAQMAPGLLNATRLEHPRYELTQAEYLKTILEAAGIIRNVMASGAVTRAPHVGLLDTVNPLPFMLGLPPSRGRQLWFDRTFPWPPADEFLNRLDYVLVPKFPVDSSSTRWALRNYGDYLAQNFRRSETESWIVFRHEDDLLPGTVAATR